MKVTSRRIESVFGILGGRLDVAVVEVENEEGWTVEASRYPEEDQWFVDAMVGPSGQVTFSHGTGSRVCLKHTLAAGAHELAGEPDWEAWR